MDFCDLPPPDRPPRLPDPKKPDPSERPRRPDPGDPPPPPPPPKIPALPGMDLFDRPAQPPPPLAPDPDLQQLFIEPKDIGGGGSRPPADSEGVDFPDDDPGADAPYLQYGCTVEYQYDAGLLQQPVAALTGAAVLSRTHAPLGRKVVRYSAARAGAQPLVPSPDPDDDNFVLLTAHIAPEQPSLDGTAQTLIFRVNATYVYAALTPRTFDQGLPVGVPAYSRVLAPATELAAENFVSGIVP